MRCQGIFTFDNTRARADHRASSLAFSRWGAFSATVATSPAREFFPIGCLCRLKNIFLLRGSRVGSYSLGTWTLLPFGSFRIGIAPLLYVGGAANPLQPEHAQEGSILEGAEERPTEAHEAKSPVPPAVRE